MSWASEHAGLAATAHRPLDGNFSLQPPAHRTHQLSHACKVHVFWWRTAPISGPKDALSSDSGKIFRECRRRPWPLGKARNCVLPREQPWCVQLPYWRLLGIGTEGELTHAHWLRSAQELQCRQRTSVDTVSASGHIVCLPQRDSHSWHLQRSLPAASKRP